MILIHSTTLRNAQAMLSGSTEKPSGSWGPSLSDGWTYFSKYNYEYSYEDSVHYAATQGAHQFTGDLAVIRIILDEGAAGFSEGENKQHFDRWYEGNHERFGLICDPSSFRMQSEACVCPQDGFNDLLSKAYSVELFPFSMSFLDVAMVAVKSSVLPTSKFDTNLHYNEDCRIDFKKISQELLSEFIDMY